VRALAALVVVLAGLAPAAAAPGNGRAVKTPGTITRVEHRDPSTVPSRGPAVAPVTIELFFSPKTNATSRMPIYRALERLQANHPTRIRLVYRVLKRAGWQLLAIAALEAHAQGKFDELMTVLHDERRNESLVRDRILELGERAGMDLPRLEAALSGGRYDRVFDANEHRLARLTHTHAPGENVLFNGRTIRASLGAPSHTDLEREYVAAYERALELMDRGVPVERLANAFDEQALRREQPFVMWSGDDDFEDPAIDHRLASPPLDLRGLPSFAKAGASATIPIVVLCRPDDRSCHNTLGIIRKIQRIYADDIRIVWAPWFDVARDDAAQLAMLGDAALCAEQLGSSPDDLDESAGWVWVTRQLAIVSRAHGRRILAERLIDLVTAELGLDSKKLSACRARTANTTLGWIEKSRRSGVTRSPAIVIGGRIYEGLNDADVIQQLIEAELAPGVLGRCATTGCSP
jgi:protein-disulfide isomerase